MYIISIKSNGREKSGVSSLKSIWIWPASEIRQKPVLIERRLRSWTIEYNIKWNQPYLSRGSNSLNSASGQTKSIAYRGAGDQIMEE